jgi:exopolysaccharide biosynthesis polyprenyl glycosylphosphotransferase
MKPGEVEGVDFRTARPMVGGPSQEVGASSNESPLATGQVIRSVVSARGARSGGLALAGGYAARRSRSRPSGLGPTLAAMDLSLVYLAVLAVEHRFRMFGAVSVLRRMLFLVAVPAWVGAAAAEGLYDRAVELDGSPVIWLPSLLRAASIGSVVLFGLAWALGLPATVAGLCLLIAVSFLATALGRIAVHSVRRRRTRPIAAVILGPERLSGLVAEKLARHDEYHIRVIGLVTDEPGARGTPQLPVLGRPGELETIIGDLGIGRVFVSGSYLEDESTLELLRRSRDVGVDVHVLPVGFRAIAPVARLHWIEGLPLIALRGSTGRRSRLAVKRVMDAFGALVGMVALAPVFVAVAVGIKLDSPGPVFYRHERLGRGGKPFRAFKFRTMHLDACRGERYGGGHAEARFAALVAAGSEFQATYKFRNDPRVTRFGRLLRRTSLDELPQLLNVLRGQISLVGPRPITADELSRYGRWDARLFRATPGMTGFWQVNGRSDVSYDERVRLDMAYVDGWSLRLDATILARTLGALRSGAS